MYKVLYSYRIVSGVSTSLSEAIGPVSGCTTEVSDVYGRCIVRPTVTFT